jgi:hypothetical protein
MSRFARSLKWKMGITALVVVIGLTVSLVSPHRASAQYVESNLIDNNLFLDAASMSQQGVQNFLQARGGYIANYTTWSGRDNATVYASQIIWEAAQDYGISPKVILATLQKEESLVTDPSPYSSQLEFAMGYGCGDSSGCAGYSGFFNQVDNATWQLRLNYERANGNTTWWRPTLGYACGGSTQYYSTGLYVGRTVTFYDDHGTPYKTILMNNAATASLYCYTPHAYPGSAAEFYSGSYNFVTMYEQWFGSTQPSVEVATQLYISALPQGMYTNTPVTVAFSLYNNTGSAVNVGSMSVAVRDQNNGNHDYALKAMTVPAHGVATYTDSQVFPSAGTYHFWITNFNNGAWSDTSPTSSSIDNARTFTMNVLPMPTISVQPTSNVTDMRQGKSAQMSFTVTNTSSSSSINAGSMALAVRAPNGANADLPLIPVTIPAGGSYTYNQTLQPQMTGTYTAWVTDTTNNGATWNETNFPANGSGVQRKVTFNVGSSPTLTQGPTLSIASPRVGQTVATSFKVKNYGDGAVNLGTIGMAIRDPNGRNVDSGSATVSVNGGTEYTFTANTAFQTPGTYTAWVADTRDNGATWNDTNFPTAESSSVARKITFTVLPSPTVTVAPTVTTTDPRVGGTTAATFTLHNYGSSDVNAGSMALAVRDPNGRNADFALQNITIPAGQDYVYTASRTELTPGTYTAWITSTRDNGATWNDTSYPTMESASMARKFTFTVKDNPTLTQGPTLSIASPHVGQAVTDTFKVKNYADQSVHVGLIAIAIRDPNGRNVDTSSLDLTVNANSEYTFSANSTFQTAGTYTAWITVTRDGGQTWDNATYPAADSGSVARKITFTVQP